MSARTATLAAALAVAVAIQPAVAQEHDHSMHQSPPAEEPAQPDPHAGHAMPEPDPSDPHAGHAMPEPEQSDPHAGHAMPEPEPSDPHAGHAMPEPEPSDPHAGHDMAPVEEGAVDHAAMGHAMPDRAATAEPIEPIPPVTPADRAAAFPDVAGHTIHDDAVHSFWLVDRLEAWDAEEGGTGLGWEAQAWIGTDLDRLWLRSEGEHVGGSLEAADLEVLYGRAIARWWDGLVGVRHAFGHGPSDTALAVGVTGVAPYRIEVDATAYLGGAGDASLAIEAEYDMLFTNRLVLQWVGEAVFHASDDPRHGVGAGLSTVEAGLRLRYEIRREFAPYVGLGWERAYGDTADFRPDGHASETRVVAGLRVWF